MSGRSFAVARRALVALVMCGLAAAACADDSSSGGARASDSTSSGATTASTTTASTTTSPPTTTTVPFDSPVAKATVKGPITGGRGSAMVVAGMTDVTKLGYTETEYFLSGTATAYTSDTPLSSDGKWTVREGGTAPYVTRVVVRRPKDATTFNGTVLVEWLNVTGGLDAGPDWSYMQPEILRSGYAWVGVSAQRVGIEGGGIVLGENRVLKVYDPARYGELSHPGDNFSYDMFSQAGAVVRRDPASLLGDLKPGLVLAIGESQSASRLTTYVNAVAQTAKVFNGYFIHSRSATGAALSSDPLPPVAAPLPTQIRSDLTTPVLVFSSETDVAGPRGYRKAAQPDTAVFRAWEPAGTAHADQYSLEAGVEDSGSGAVDVTYYAAQQKPPTSIRDGLITCATGINTGGQTYVLRAALKSFNAWVRSGTPPPSMPQLEVDATGNAYVLDAAGNAKGGIRTPHVDAPIAALGGLGQIGNAFCSLFGTTVPFDDAVLKARYGTHDAFVAQFTEATKKAVAAGVMIQVDADHLVAAAQASTVAN
jgi:hypothetical protein